MSKPVLLIKTGGTIRQKPNEKGALEPISDDYLELWPHLKEIADVRDLGSIDSTNMETNLVYTNPTQGEKLVDRSKLARAIYDNAFNYEGFVVVHGTDTMAETAAALTYMLHGLGKPIIMTGSQRSAWARRTDAPNNIEAAIQAATMDIGEVAIAFGNWLLIGPKAIKVDEEGYDAFATPGTEPLAKITSLEEGIGRLAPHTVPRKPGDVRLFTDFDTRVFHYGHVSGATVDEDLMKIAESEYNHGIILTGFGAGNLPSRMLPFIKAAYEHEKPVYVVTRSSTGAADMGIYQVGLAAVEMGAQPAGDMTLEAVGQKLMYALGRAQAENRTGDSRLNYINNIMKTSYNGDITILNARTSVQPMRKLMVS